MLKIDDTVLSESLLLLFCEYWIAFCSMQKHARQKDMCVYIDIENNYKDNWSWHNHQYCITNMLCSCLSHSHIVAVFD